MGRKSKWNINNIQEFLDSTDSGCKLVTKNFKYLKDNLEFQCKCGKHFYRNFHNLVSQKVIIVMIVLKKYLLIIVNYHMTII